MHIPCQKGHPFAWEIFESKLGEYFEASERQCVLGKNNLSYACERLRTLASQREPFATHSGSACLNYISTLGFLLGVVETEEPVYLSSGSCIFGA